MTLPLRALALYRLVIDTESTFTGDLEQSVRSGKALKKKILAEKKERLIRFRGKCTLSTGVALGATFPTIGGWASRFLSPPRKTIGDPMPPATTPYDAQVEVIEASQGGTDIVVGLNVRGDGRKEISEG